MSKYTEKNELTELELNNLDEESLIELLNDDLDLIKLIKNPGLRIQKRVIRKDVNYFSYILEPHISVINEVARLKPSLLREEMFDIESVQKILMSKNPRYARKFTKMSNSIKQSVAENMPNLLNYENEVSFQRIAFMSNNISIKYFKDCCLLDIDEIMYRSSAAACVYLDNVDKDLISKHIDFISPIFYGRINEYTEDILRYVFTYKRGKINYLICDKMLKVDGISDIVADFSYGNINYAFRGAPYDILKGVISQCYQLCNIVDFKDEYEILSAINSNKNVVKILKSVPESILPNVPKYLYSKIKYFGEVSKETQKMLLNYDIKLAGKIKNLDLDLVREFCMCDDSIIRYSRVLDDDLISHGLIYGILNSNEFIGIDKNKLTKIMFLCKELKRRC